MYVGARAIAIGHDNRRTAAGCRGSLVATGAAIGHRRATRRLADLPGRIARRRWHRVGGRRRCRVRQWSQSRLVRSGRRGTAAPRRRRWHTRRLILKLRRAWHGLLDPWLVPLLLKLLQ